MPNAPTIRMRTLAARWLTDLVTLSDATFVADTRPIGKASETVTGAVTVRALVRQDVVALTDTVTARRDVRELRVWIDDACVDVSPGQRLTVVECGDVSLVGRIGQVIAVERDSVKAVRRCTVRLGNDD